MMYRMTLVLLGACAVSQAQTPVGLLSMVSGSVQILRAGQKAPVAARTADLLAVGDRVLTGRNSEASFLFCPESRAGKIPANGEVQFDASALQVRKGKLAEERKVPSCRLPANLSLAAASQLQSGMLRVRGKHLVLRSPSLTSIHTLQPRFRWGPVDEARDYDIKLMDREERVLWRRSVSATEVQYPGDAHALAWGQKYWWRVTARGGQDVLSEAGTHFQVLAQEAAERVRAAEGNLRRMMEENPADNGPRFLLAFLYEDNGMLDEATRAYGELADRMGKQDWVQGRLNELMNKLGWDRLDSSPPR